MVEVNQNKKILDYNLKFYRYFEKKLLSQDINLIY